MAEDDNFFSRWSRRKTVERGGGAAPAAPAESQAQEPGTALEKAPFGLPQDPSDADATESATVGAQEAPALTLADVAALTRESDYSAFVARGVAPEVRNAALKQLFTDPHYNVMDGLDTYIDDYGIPDPLPPGMLRQMTQSAFLNLFDDDPEAPDADAQSTAESTLSAASASPCESTTAPQLAQSESVANDGALKPAPSGPAPESLPECPPETTLDEDPDLRLQPDDAAGRAGIGAGAGEDPRRQR